MHNLFYRDCNESSCSIYALKKYCEREFPHYEENDKFYQNFKNAMYQLENKLEENQIKDKLKKSRNRMLAHNDKRAFVNFDLSIMGVFFADLFELCDIFNNIINLIAEKINIPIQKDDIYNQEFSKLIDSYNKNFD